MYLYYYIFLFNVDVSRREGDAKTSYADFTGEWWPLFKSVLHVHVHENQLPAFAATLYSLCFFCIFYQTHTELQ